MENMEVLRDLLSRLSRRGDGDAVDHMSATTTVGILIVSSLIVSAKQFLFQPMQCWVPAQFTQSMEQYTENYCYIQNTYWVGSMDANIPNEVWKRERAELNYYQWVPFILLAQAALFYLPRIVWRSMSSLSGIDFYCMHTMAHECELADAIRGDNLKRALANFIIAAIELNRGSKVQGVSVNPLRKYCPFIAFLISKSLYFLNAFGQLFVLNAILGGSTSAESSDGRPVGVNLVRNLMNGTDWSSSGWFPRVTLCDFEVRVLGNLHRYTVQCVLMINMFNEKLYASLWVWTLLIAVVSLFSLAYWSYQLCARRSRLRFLMRLLPKDIVYDAGTDLNLLKFASAAADSRWESFFDDFLDMDGIFLLRSIDMHAGSILASQLLAFLYEHFLKKEKLLCRRHAIAGSESPGEMCYQRKSVF